MSFQTRVHEKVCENHLEVHYLEGLYKETFVSRNRGKWPYGHPSSSFDRRGGKKQTSRAKARTRAVKAKQAFKEELLSRYGD